jgi:hypothetical protein
MIAKIIIRKIFIESPEKSESKINQLDGINDEKKDKNQVEIDGTATSNPSSPPNKSPFFILSVFTISYSYFYLSKCKLRIELN